MYQYLAAAKRQSKGGEGEGDDGQTAQQKC